MPLSHWHPRAGVRLFRVAGTRRLHGARRNVTQAGRVNLPLANAIPESHRIAREHIQRSEKLHDLFFKEVPEYPGFAWQEAIVNAIAHRDYGVQGREVEVCFYEDRMVRPVFSYCVGWRLTVSPPLAGLVGLSSPVRSD
ncbi:MAG: hypothetical protein BMS9Abin37_3244 [Acidobacteriota bacterium]|nr:MAG: hypothetical protein BMS9Abin37_3244 [Acidobacteriota bacterium]